MTNAVIKAFVDLDSLRSCANDPCMVDEGLKEQGLTLALRMKVVATVSALVAEPGAAPPPAEPAAEDEAPEAPAPVPPPARVWTPVRDPQGRTYYWNEQTGETTWTLPSFVGPRAAAPLPRVAPPPPREERSHARPAAAPAPAPATIDLTADSGDEASAPPPDSDDDDDSATPPPSAPVEDDDDDEEDDAAAAPAPATTAAPAPAASPAAVEGAAAPLPQQTATPAGEWRIVGAHAQVQHADESTVRGVITYCPSGWKEVTTTTGSVVVVRPSQLTQATLTDEEAMRCVRPASRKDYVQARIDGAIRFSHGGREFKNRYTAADGTERWQFEVTATHVRCALCGDAHSWSLATDITDTTKEVKRHCGQAGSGSIGVGIVQNHLNRLVQSAGAPAPAPPPRARPVGRGFVGAFVQDRKGLEARMDADGWTREEKQRPNSTHVDRYFLPPNGGKKLRSHVEVARTAYPEFLVKSRLRTPPAGRVVVDADDEAAPLPPDTTGDEALARKLAAGALLPMRRPKRGRADDVDDEAPAFEVGARIRARWGQRWYPGTVDDVIDRPINDGGRAYEIVWDELDDKGRRLFNKVPAVDVRAPSEEEEEEVPAAPAPPPVVPAPASPRPMPPFDPLASPPVGAEAPPPPRRTPVPPRAMDLETLSEGQLREEARRRGLDPRPSDGKRELLAKLQGDVPVAITPPPRRGTADDHGRGRAKKKPRQAPNGTQPPPRSPYMMGLDAAAHGSQRID